MRTFIAVDVTSCNSIGKLQNDIMSSTKWMPRDVKPVALQNFHFTIMFLGEVSDVEMIKNKMQELQFEPFTLTYQGIGAYPKPSAAKIIWVGTDREGGYKLVKLANDVIAKIAELGFSADKPFSPHMTIFRVKGYPVSMGDISMKYDGRTFGSDLIDRVHLKKSDLVPSGPIYSNIYTVEAKK